MTKEWRMSTKLIAGIKAIENIHNQNRGILDTKAEYETCLSGSRGEIWEYSLGVYRVLVYNHRAANALAKDLGIDRKYKPGDEAVFTIRENTLPVAFSRVRLPISHSTKARLANLFRSMK